MNATEIKQAEAVLSTLKTITEKLNYWNENFNKNECNYEFTQNHNIITAISIPKELYLKHFEPFSKTPDFTFWFLEFYSKDWSKYLLNAMDFDKKKDTPLYKVFIEAELNDIDVFEKKALELLRNKSIDIYSSRDEHKYLIEVEYLRVKNNYYKDHVYSNLDVLGSTTKTIFAKYVFIKNLLLDELERINKNEPRQNNKDSVQIIPTTIADLFEVEDWQKYIEALTECKPKILKNDNGKYRFIGSVKIHRGVIAAWFKALKEKGIINQSFNKYTIAEVLTKEIINYSISHSSVNNKSLNYEKIFEKQLLDYIK